MLSLTECESGTHSSGVVVVAQHHSVDLQEFAEREGAGVKDAELEMRKGEKQCENTRSKRMCMLRDYTDPFFLQGSALHA